jgi:hypothetical protein
MSGNGPRGRIRAKISIKRLCRPISARAVAAGVMETTDVPRQSHIKEPNGVTVEDKSEIPQLAGRSIRCRPWAARRSQLPEIKQNCRAGSAATGEWDACRTSAALATCGGFNTTERSIKD